MIDLRRIALVVPARDEEKFLGSVLAAIPAWVDEVIVVDDGSTDATGEVALRWSQRRVRVRTHRPGRGVGAALLAGYALALETGVDAVAVVAGDAQMHLGELASVLAPVVSGEADYVQGTRFPNGRLRGRMPWSRRLGNRVLSKCTAWAARTAVSDSQCGYTAASRAFVRALLRMPIPPGYGFPAFVRWHAHAQSWRVVERPVTAIYGNEVSGIRPWLDPWRILLHLLALRLARRATARSTTLVRRPT